MKGPALLLAAALLAAPAAVAAQGTQAAPPTDVTTVAPATVTGVAKPAAEEKICKTSAKTGSRIRMNKVCKTQREWDQSRRDAGRALDSLEGEQMRNKAPLPSVG